MGNNILVDKILTTITPIVGDIMAKSTIKVHCESVGISPDSLTRGELPSLAQRIEALLQIFVGTDKAKEIANNIVQITL